MKKRQGKSGPFVICAGPFGEGRKYTRRQERVQLPASVQGGMWEFFAGEWSSKSQPVTKTGKKIRWGVYSGKKVFCLAHVEVPGVGFCTRKSKAVTQVNRSLVP